ncbi:hypothetical protein QUB60_14670 [Microcoleus sp. A2-C5]|uniref:hypothetical protein n=1 Tax=unclassified Microcoleus TaxID=2642155 RepID=UPI002FD39773
MELTTREDVIEAGRAAIKSRGNTEEMTKLINRVQEYRDQKRPVDINRCLAINFWYEDLDKNFEKITIEKFNDSLSNLP